MSYRVQPPLPVLGETFSALTLARIGPAKKRRVLPPTFALPTDAKWLHIPPTVVNTLKMCCDVGSALHSGVGTGDEYGGHFNTLQNENDEILVDPRGRVTVVGISSHELSVGHTSVGDDTTGVNSGDHPFTFHTHP